MNAYAKQFEQTMTRLDPWYEKDMSDWIWDSVIEQYTYYGAFNPGGDLLNVWRSVNGRKKMPNFLDGYDEWLRTFEEYESEDENEQFVFIKLAHISRIVDEIIKDFTDTYHNYKMLAIASDDAPLGAIPFATRRSKDKYITEPDTKVEDELEDDLKDHYEQQGSIAGRPNAIALLKKLNRSKEYDDLFSAPVGKRVYRGICVDVETMKKILGKNMPKQLVNGEEITVTNVVVKPKGFSSWTTDVSIATRFIGAGIGMVFTALIDEKNESAFILNPKLSAMFSYEAEKETVQIKPVHIDSVIVYVREMEN